MQLPMLHMLYTCGIVIIAPRVAIRQSLHLASMHLTKEDLCFRSLEDHDDRSCVLARRRRRRRPRRSFF